MKIGAMVAGLVFVGLAWGCGVRYVTPGGPADMEVFSDRQIAEKWNRKPAAKFPARIALARVQASGYRSTEYRSYGHGQYSVVTTREVETEEQLERISELPDVAGLAALNRMLLSQELNSDIELRDAAASLQADMILLYTFDTSFHTDKVIPAADVLTLGLFPDRSAKVTTTASALLMDTRTGFVYAAVESTAREDQAANAWTNRDAIDDARRRAEARAFDQLVDEFAKAWKDVRSTHATRDPRASAVTLDRPAAAR
jgi:hypothetical protein